VVLGNAKGFMQECPLRRSASSSKDASA
jgi:hypothetical protein